MTETRSDAQRVKDAWKAVREPAPVDAPAPQVQARARRKGKVRPWQRVDALNQEPLYQPLAEQLTAVPLAPNPLNFGVLPPDQFLDYPHRTPLVVKHQERPVAHGVETILARLAKVGVVLKLTPDAQHLTVVSQTRVLAPELRQAIETAAPLVLAALQGNPLTCSWCKDPATTLLLLGAPACEVHAAAIDTQPQAPA